MAGDSLAPPGNLLDSVLERLEPSRHEPDQLTDVPQEIDERPLVLLDLRDPFGHIAQTFAHVAIANLAGVVVVPAFHGPTIKDARRPGNAARLIHRREGEGPTVYFHPCTYTYMEEMPHGYEDNHH